jgi:hypothetical protein
VIWQVASRYAFGAILDSAVSGHDDIEKHASEHQKWTEIRGNSATFQRLMFASGWEATLARYRKAKVDVAPANGQETCTVGEFLEAIFLTTTNQNTVEGYAKSFKQIVSDIFGLSDGYQKHDCRKGGFQKWLASVLQIKLADVTPARVQEWKRSLVAKAGTDAIALRKARISVNSIMR